MRTLMTVLVALALAVPGSAQIVTKQYTFFGCSAWACHTARFEFFGTGEGYGRVLEGYRYSVLSRYKKSGYPRMYGFPDTPGIFPLINDTQAPVNSFHCGPEIFDPFMVMVWPGRWRPTTIGVQDVLCPKGTFFSQVGDFVGWTTLHLVPEPVFDLGSTTHVTPEPASLLLLGTGLAGIAGAAAKRRRRM